MKSAACKARVRVKLRSAKREDILEDAMSYRIPMEVTQILRLSDKLSFPVCPRCKITVEREYMRFCDRCGQKLGWAKIKDAILVQPGFFRGKR